MTYKIQISHPSCNYQINYQQQRKKKKKFKSKMWKINYIIIYYILYDVYIIIYLFLQKKKNFANKIYKIFIWYTNKNQQPLNYDEWKWLTFEKK